jgi:hypothetical protein
MYPAVGTVSASVARDFYLTGGEQSRRGALRSRRNSGSLSRVIATAVAAADRVASKDTKQRSPQAEKRARLRRRHTEPPGTRFAAIHSRTFVHLRLILCAQESDVWTRPGSVKVSSSQPRLGHINSRLVCLVPSSRPLASMLRWVSKLSLWSRWTHGPSPEDDEQEAQRILRAKAGHGSQPSLQAATTKVTGIAVTTRRTQLNTFRDARLVVDDSCGAAMGHFLHSGDAREPCCPVLLPDEFRVSRRGLVDNDRGSGRSRCRDRIQGSVLRD